MSITYVSGHRNPDTDSVVSAMAYAALKNSLGERDVIAVRLGEINKETDVVLEKFGFDPPMLISTVKTQLSDVAFDKPPIIGSGVTVRKAWDIMNEFKAQTLCIADENGELIGTIAMSDIAEHDMQSAFDGFYVDTTAFNLASSMEGRHIGTGEEWDIIQGPIRIAVHDDSYYTNESYKGCVLISGNNSRIVDIAKKVEASCLVLCKVDALSELAKQAAESGMHVIQTHYDPYRACRLISHSVPVSSMMRKDDLPIFHLSDFLDDVRNIMLSNRAPSYPVLDDEDKVVGMVARFHLLNHSRKRVILVDHNESAQSIPGLEQAELLEIIDHHRVADLQTAMPVYFRNEPVGSATTIVAAMYFEYGVTPSKRMAGLIAGAILSDTVMFKSPTCTEKDKRMAFRMAKLAGIDLTKLGEEIFSAASNIAENDPKTLLFSDFKEFTIADHKIGIGQVTCMNVDDLLPLENDLLVLMQKERKVRSLEYMMLMETEIVKEGTKLLFCGDAKEMLEKAFDCTSFESSILLPNVMSRKKQIVPAISAVLA